MSDKSSGAAQAVWKPGRAPASRDRFHVERSIAVL